MTQTVVAVVCIPLFLFRRVWQDRGATFQWREHTPHLPTDTEHVADQYAELDELTVQPDASLVSGHDDTSVQPI